MLPVMPAVTKPGLQGDAGIGHFHDVGEAGEKEDLQPDVRGHRKGRGPLGPNENQADDQDKGTNASDGRGHTREGHACAGRAGVETGVCAEHHQHAHQQGSEEDGGLLQGAFNGHDLVRGDRVWQWW
ncbi:MAG: hypothetical protein CM15mP18_4440 [Methanobacteriota archaeon]|nr:MAG: hypothetical protein CM15mP18_4440 [Euryarchaeota archaeon]